jgi:outer membrane murein-binding lipoprotein Lpp
MDPDDTTAIISGVFELNAKLAELAADVNVIRTWLVDDDEEEET